MQIRGTKGTQREPGGTIRIIAFLTDNRAIDRTIDHLKLTFAAERPRPPEGAFQELLLAANRGRRIFSVIVLEPRRRGPVDFRRFWAFLRPASLFRPVSAQLDKLQYLDLSWPTIGGGRFGG